MLYNKNLRLSPSVLQPHCLACKCLLLWLPLNNPREDSQLLLSETDLQWVFTVISHAYVASTLETYGSGLLVFHIFCDLKGVPESQQAPANTLLVLVFVAALARSYSGDAIANYMAAIHAWHILHGINWAMNYDQLKALHKGSSHLAPPVCKCQKQSPYTISFLLEICTVLDLKNPLQAALTTTFYCICQLGKQDGLTDPKLALDNHLAINNLHPLEEALFSYTHTNGKRRPLTWRNFLKCLAEAGRKAGVDVPPAHGICIGSVLEYLLQGMPFIVMQHAEILAPYMQANSLVLSESSSSSTNSENLAGCSCISFSCLFSHVCEDKMSTK
ncbi:hypothetical protein BT96DRAFT_956605 [Gymnopus androsaceus JB14]|uniref:Uncharacterized protein n=1 Tax=Gymnopus androsaceus JB14 TaxID=1447944 RepID=A0A6A4HS29_9AGAR|nr:hypothetical protein BT96DRAFT_956605 [Gymnopus androsaceus JB14]